MAALLDDERVVVAGVVLGADASASLHRTITRGIAHGHGGNRKRTFGDVGEAVRWVAGELQLDATDVYKTVERARKVSIPAGPATNL